jgi:hypothetical protein
MSAAEFDTGGIRESNDDGQNEEHGHDGECEDPLQSNGSSQELTDTES